MYYVYFLKSDIDRSIYLGSTNNIKRRIEEHNQGMSQSTKSKKPWKLIGYIALRSEKRIRELEQYFKHGSGKAVLYKRILTDEVPQSGT